MPRAGLFLREQLACAQCRASLHGSAARAAPFCLDISLFWPLVYSAAPGAPPRRVRLRASACFRRKRESRVAVDRVAPRPAAFPEVASRREIGRSLSI